jgi:hypothetical protein
MGFGTGYGEGNGDGDLSRGFVSKPRSGLDKSNIKVQSKKFKV